MVTSGRAAIRVYLERITHTTYTPCRWPSLHGKSEVLLMHQIYYPYAEQLCKAQLMGPVLPGMITCCCLGNPCQKCNSLSSPFIQVLKGTQYFVRKVFVLWKQTMTAAKTELGVITLLAFFLASPWLCRRRVLTRPCCPPIHVPPSVLWGRGCACVYLQSCGSSSSAQVPPDCWLYPTIRSLRSP